MDEKKFSDKCRELVASYTNDHLDKSDQKEITYNGDKDEVYFDAYKKWENKAIKA